MFRSKYSRTAPTPRSDTHKEVVANSRCCSTNALISGSFALQFFERVTWPESDLDILVEEGDGLEEMKKYLTGSEGYTKVPQPESTSEIEVEVGEEQGDYEGFYSGNIKEVGCLTILQAGSRPNQFHSAKHIFFLTRTRTLAM